MSRRATVLVGAAMCTVLLSSCSGDDSDGSASPEGTRRTTTSIGRSTSSTEPQTSSTTTEPPTTEVEAVRPVLEALIDRYDAAVAAILVDPRVAGDRDHPAVREYLSLFAPGSEFPDGALEFWINEGRRGRFYRPGPRGQMYESTVQSVEAVSPDQADFSVCTSTSVEIVDANGSPVEAQGGVNGGDVVAVRVDDEWRLRDLTETPPTGCPEGADQP